MIRCSVCDQLNEDTATRCACGADLAVEGTAAPDASPDIDVFERTDLGVELADLDDLPDLDVPETTPTGSLPLPEDLSRPHDEGGEPVAPRAAGGDDPQPVRPSSPASPPRRDFAVQPRDDSGEPERGGTPGRSPRTAPSEEASVRSAPIVDDEAHSVFNQPLSSWSATALRAELDQDRAGGTVTCPTCGREVRRGQHFCKCGYEFDIPVRQPHPDEPEPARLTSLWRRLTGTAKTQRGDQRSWGQRARDAGARRGMTYGTRLSARSRFGGIALIAAGGVGLIALVGPLRNTVRDLPGLFLPTTVETIDWEAEDTCDAPAKGDAPWQARWTATGADGLHPGCDGVITGSFEEAVDVDRFRIEFGNTSGQGDAILTAQPVKTPHRIEVEFIHAEGGEQSTEELELADNSAEQEYRIDVDDVTGFVVRIETVQTGENRWPELDIVQIGRIAFVRE